MNKTSIEIINFLIDLHPHIDELEFVSFDYYAPIQDRMNINNETETIINNALNIRSQYGFPFWDCFNVSLFNKNLTDFNFLKQIKFHNKKLDIISIERKNIGFFLSGLDKSKYLTFSSKVKLNNKEIKHIPLLDFHIPISQESENICIKVLKELGLEGFLLNSGKSYHFYGKDLMTETQLIDKLSYSLLFSPIIDRAWIAHQLIERSCCLRISGKYSILPFKICDI